MRGPIFIRNGVIYATLSAFYAFCAGLGPNSVVTAILLSGCALTYILAAANILAYHHERKANDNAHG